MTPKRNPEITSRIMSKIKYKDTKVEIILGREMWKLKLRYRKHYHLIGKPDFVFVRKKIVIFCDGDFWHGRNFSAMVENGRFDNNPGYWIPKMLKTIERDRKIVLALEADGWKVIRLWETEILKAPTESAQLISGIVNNIKGN